MQTKRILLSGLMTAVLPMLVVACSDDDPSTGPGDDSSGTMSSDGTTSGTTGTTTTTGPTGTTTTTSPGGNTGATGIDTDTSGVVDSTSGMWDADAAVTGSSSDTADAGFTDAGVWMDASTPDGGGDAGAWVDLNDGEILQVFWTANAGEVAQGEIALEKASAQEVLDFAELMVMAHTSAQAKADIVVMEEDIALEPNAVATALQASSEAVIQTLEAAAADSAAFDLLYMRAQVAQHESVLALLRDQLIPQADNDELVALLGEAEADVAAHLSAAQSLVVELEADE